MLCGPISVQTAVGGLLESAGDLILPKIATARRGGFEGGVRPQALRGAVLQKRGVGGRLGRDRHPAGDRALPARQGEAAGGDSAREPQASLWDRRNAGEDAGGARPQDRGEDLRLHLRLPG